MTTLQRNALGRLPMDAARVEWLYAEVGKGRSLEITPTVFRELCESHERLRFEVEGAKILLDALETRGQSRVE